MRKLILTAAAVLICSATLLAQTSATQYLDVKPGFGTLDSAIAQNKGSVIYRLQAGGWYILNGQIENNGFALTIVGTTPAPGQMPAAIQTATNADGTVLGDMFNVVGDLTIKDVFIVNANAENTMGQGVFSVTSPTSVRIDFDSLTVDPIGSNHFIVFNPTPYPKLFMTNSLLLRHGTLDGANDWCLFDLAGPVNNGYDTLYLENNTFVSTGTHIAINRNGATDSNNFVWINHNTFAFHKFGLIEGYHMNSYYVTNNLLFDFDTQPYNLAWDAYSPDGFGDKYQSLVLQDTTAADSNSYGQIQSTRKLLVGWNDEYVDPRIESYINNWQWTHTLNDTGSKPVGDINQAYLMRLAYPPDSAKVNREAGMYWSSGFPDFKFFDYYEQDPDWSNPEMYAIQDSIVKWDLPAMELNNWGFSPSDVPAPASSGNWWWCADSTYNLGNPVVWPRFNGAYTNSTLMTASTAGLPLGDLNWFPKAKALWEANKASIMAHIVAEDTSHMVLTGIQNIIKTLPTQFQLSQNYPNPFNPTTQIVYSLPAKVHVSLTVYNVLGQRVATLFSGIQSPGDHIATFNGDRLASGVYFYRLSAGGFSSVKKMLLLK